ncbi:YceI family protein [Alteromonas sp. KUL49]|uniref:YceI family protein n=1 Tax=Alteromonas sp. KUL49 TaxID=2480798 RepID=UPI00102EE95F|nr:YceI family protein [Alteromonas sp. KUL49]TAP34289.1 YceI family protein [Alteromonas sp. KUL49]GEA13599.1 hypothetical protein KUL49_39740 [Alteromonas sp. KUL49]
MKYLVTAMLLVLAWSGSVFAKTLIVDNDNGSLLFSGEHAGMAFEGRFNQWRAKLILPPAASPEIEASFSLSSAETGDSMYDETLPEADWFDVENFPQAVFSSRSIVAVGGGFKVSGELSLKGVSNSVEFLLENSETGYTANFAIDRIAYGIGVESDPEAEWVSQFIELRLVIPSSID